MVYFGAIVLSSHLLVSVADKVPTIDIKETCRGAAAGLLKSGGTEDVATCIAQEQHAHDQMVSEWPSFPDAAKAWCGRIATDYLPSYVEMLGCLEKISQGKRMPRDRRIRR
jgi:hypothetical protein